MKEGIAVEIFEVFYSVLRALNGLICFRWFSAEPIGLPTTPADDFDGPKNLNITLRIGRMQALW